MDVVFCWFLLRNLGFFVVVRNHRHRKQEVPKGTKLITEGDLDADYFYIVQSGRGPFGSRLCWKNSSPIFTIFLFYWKKGRKAVFQTFDVVLDDWKFDMQVLLQWLTTIEGTLAVEEAQRSSEISSNSVSYVLFRLRHYTKIEGWSVANLQMRLSYATGCRQF